jgi:bifunctional UDP-N-acetylglucosamine pyrophosphorylase/glucosamine-1-phosphate N-acetyltransferase/UDP-N-acetylglucosamine pyrophosphorylase
MTAKETHVMQNLDSPLAIVLAAGKGTRMKSELPKVLCEANGRPLLHYVIDALKAGGVERFVVVVGYRAESVQSALADVDDVQFAFQTEQLGTGHAVMMCRELIQDHHGAVVVVAGDSPMLQADSIRRLLAEFSATRPACVLGSLIHPDPTGLGRIVRDANGKFIGIVEHKDATPVQLAINETNMSTYVFDCQKLLGALDQLTDNNQQHEYYLTDVPAILLASGEDVRALPVLKPIEALSVNTLDHLAEVEAAMQAMEAAAGR